MDAGVVIWNAWGWAFFCYRWGAWTPLNLQLCSAPIKLFPLLQTAFFIVDVMCAILHTHCTWQIEVYKYMITILLCSRLILYSKWYDKLKDNPSTCLRRPATGCHNGFNTPCNWSEGVKTVFQKKKRYSLSCCFDVGAGGNARDPFNTTSFPNRCSAGLVTLKAIAYNWL